MPDGKPLPAMLDAATTNTYDVPLASPVTVVLVVLDVPSANTAHVEPLFEEYLTV